MSTASQPAEPVTVHIEGRKPLTIDRLDPPLIRAIAEQATRPKWKDWSENQHPSTSSMDRWNDGLVEPHLTKPGMRILDVGCGNGVLADKLRGMGHDAWGLDIDAPPNPHVIRADMEQPPDLSGDPYDLILCFENLEHIIHDYEALAAMNSWLKPGGRLVMSTPNEKGGEYYGGHIRHYLAWSLDLLLRYAGFTAIDVHTNPKNQAGLLVQATRPVTV